MNNLLTWGLQVTVLVALGAVVSRMLGNARARLWFWQGLLAVAVLLPVAQPWKQPPVQAISAETSTRGSAISLDAVPVAAPSYWERLGWVDLLIAGAGLRFAWLAVGLLRLRRLRLQARPIVAPITAYGEAVNWYASDGITGPVTFGRTVMLPRRVMEMPEEMRYSIARHELLHIERGDWWFVLAEETLRGVLWFHPAVWFALGQVQLAREQVVDREVVDATLNQASYLEALVAVASQRMHPDIAPAIAPAPLFLKKRQLAVRVKAVMKEGPMSRTMLLVRGTVAAAAMAVVVTAGVWMFPLVGSAQTRPDGPGITVNPGAAVFHRTPVYHPGGSATGTIVVDANISKTGEVTDAHVVSGPDELRKAVLANVLDWHYASQPPPPTRVQVTVTFAQGNAQGGAQSGALVAPPPPPPPGAAGRGARGATAVAGGAVGGVVGGLAQGPTVVAAIRMTGLSPELARAAEQALGVKVGDTLPTPWDPMPKLRAVDEHLGIYTLRSLEGEATLILSIGGPSGVIGQVGTPQPPPPPIQPPAGTQRVSAGVAKGLLTSQVRPEYPPIAKQARVQGTILLSVVIGETGSVEQISVVSGPAMLRDAALDAVRQWTYRPFLLNNQPVKVLTEVEVNFALQ